MDSRDTLAFIPVFITLLRGVQLTTCVWISLLPFPITSFLVMHKDALAIILQKIYGQMCPRPSPSKWFE